MRRRLLPLVLLALLPAACTAPAPDAEEGVTMLPDVAERLARFAPTEVKADLSTLSEGQRQVLDKLIGAGRHLDRAFFRQAWAGNPEFREMLAAQEGPGAAAALAYFDVMYGPWDRQAHREAFVGHPGEAGAGAGVNMIDHPDGAGFYPEDLSKEEFEEYVKAHPEEAEALESWYTVVRREEGRLVAVPYSEAYREQLEPAAALLREASTITENESLARFLSLRADALLSDDYYQSELAWMDLDSRIEVTVGPYEVYEDGLFARKTAFEIFVTVNDPEASADLDRFKGYLPAMENNLPIPDEMKTVRGGESPIRVVDLVYSGGDTRAGVQTIAFNLPNDERIRAEKGSKKVMLRNVMKAKFDSILVPVAREVLDASQVELLSGEAFFQQTVFHELSHALGPGYVTGTETEVREALQEHYSGLEEGKADVMGAYNILFMIDKGEFPVEFREQLLATYFAGLFRSVRFGTGEAHGKGAALQINYFLEKDAATIGEDGKFLVDLPALEQAISDLVHVICVLQASGDRETAAAMMNEKAKVTPEIQQALDRLETVSVDIRPFFPAAGETRP